MYYYLYKITNSINGKIYIGAHKTDNLEDGYMGSGKILKSAIEKYGLENFEKEILQFFDDEEDMFEAESILVNEEFVSRKDTYNIRHGGFGGWDHLRKTIPVKDKKGKHFRVSKNDSRYISGELVPMFTGTVVVKDKDKNILHVKTNDSRYISGELTFIHKGSTLTEEVKKKISESNKGMKTWLGKKHSLETKQKMQRSHKGKHEGSNNSQFGTCWVYSLELKESKKIDKKELNNYIENGWIKGRKQKF